MKSVSNRIVLLSLIFTIAIAGMIWTLSRTASGDGSNSDPQLAREVIAFYGAKK